MAQVPPLANKMDESIKLILESVVAKILIANFGNGLLLEQQIISMLGNILSLSNSHSFTQISTYFIKGISGLWKDSSELAMVADRVKINIFDVVSVSGSVISDFIELSKNPNLRSSDRIDEAMNLNSQILPFNCETKLPAKYTFKRTPVLILGLRLYVLMLIFR